MAGLGAKVILEVQQSVVELLDFSLRGVARVVARGEQLPAFDYQCSLMTLPHVFRTRLDNIPAQAPYVYADRERVDAWRRRLGTSPSPRVGLAWAGNVALSRNRPYKQRRIALADIAPLTVAPVEWISLQKEVDGEERALLTALPIVQAADWLTSFAETAALLELLDLVITVDTSVAHLAAAMGKPVWIMLPFKPDWRWLLERRDSPWYPSVRLFRQGADKTWNNVIREVAHELTSLLASGDGVLSGTRRERGV